VHEVLQFLPAPPPIREMAPRGERPSGQHLCSLFHQLNCLSRWPLHRGAL